MLRQPGCALAEWAIWLISWLSSLLPTCNVAPPYKDTFSTWKVVHTAEVAPLLFLSKHSFKTTLKLCKWLFKIYFYPNIEEVSDIGAWKTSEIYHQPMNTTLYPNADMSCSLPCIDIFQLTSKCDNFEKQMFQSKIKSTSTQLKVILQVLQPVYLQMSIQVASTTWFRQSVTG